MKLRAGLAVAGIAVVAGCGGTSSGSEHAATPTTPVAEAGSASSGPSYADVATAAQRHAHAVAYASRILRDRPVLAGETAYDGTIPKHLRRPDEVPGATNRVVRKLYVAIDRSPERVYEQLKAATVPKSQLGGYGDVGAGDNGPRFTSVRFDRMTLPPDMVDGELLIEVQGRPGKPTLLAEFAQVVPHPAWPAAERIPAGPARASVVRTTYSQRHHVLHRDVVTLDDTATQRLVTAFDNSWIAPPWACTGGPVILGNTTSYRVRIHANGHLWRVDVPGYCSASAVTRDGHDLAAINAPKEFVRLAERR